jgi:3-deoxy-D-manno-octulosonic-acid transferase
MLSSIGIDNCDITGDTRFDRVCETAENIEGVPAIEQFKENNQILIAGSTWQADEEVLIEYINCSNSELKYIIAPHEIKEENINRIESSLSVKSIRYSKKDGQVLQDCKVLIIDNIGMLSMLYQYGHIAYIGGAFGKNVHNILEAAVFGMPVIYGPNYFKFKEAVDLVEKGGAFSIDNASDFRKRMEFILADPYIAKIAGEVSRAFVQGSKGATAKILEHIAAEPTD